MKKFLSTILAVVMVLSSMATVAFAADDASLTPGIYVGTGDNVSICASAENFASAYVNSSLTYTQVKDYAKYITNNRQTSNTLVADVIADIDNMESTATNLVAMFEDMLNKKMIIIGYAVSDADDRALLEGYITQLNAALAE